VLPPAVVLPAQVLAHGFNHATFPQSACLIKYQNRTDAAAVCFGARQSSCIRGAGDDVAQQTKIMDDDF